MSDLMERLKFYLRSCADPTHGYIEDLDKLEAEVTSLTTDNEELSKMYDEQSTLTDRAEAERDAMREQLDAIDKYLDIGTSDTSIHQNSVMHREVKALLGPY